MNLFQQLTRDKLQEVTNEHGQSLVEYAYILMLIAVVAVAILGTIGNRLVPFFQLVANSLS